MIKLLPVFSLAVLVSGCATIVQGPTQQVFFDSEPRGAEIEYHRKTYLTPCIISLQRSYGPTRLKARKRGFAPVIIECDTHFTALIYANIFFGGVIGIFIDLATASHMAFNEENQHFELPAIAENEIQRIETERIETERAERKRLQQLLEAEMEKREKGWRKE